MRKRPGHHRGNVHDLKIQFLLPDTALDASDALLAGGYHGFSAGFPDFIDFSVGHFAQMARNASLAAFEIIFELPFPYLLLGCFYVSFQIALYYGRFNLFGQLSFFHFSCYHLGDIKRWDLRGVIHGKDRFRFEAV